MPTLKKKNTHTMADTPSSNGSLVMPVVEKKSEKDDPNSIKNIGKAIYNPFTGRYIASEQYANILRDTGCDLADLERNNHITGFNGTMSEEDFLSQPHVRKYLTSTQGKKKHIPFSVAPYMLSPSLEEEEVTVTSNSLEELRRIVESQASIIDDLEAELRKEKNKARQLTHDMETMYYVHIRTAQSKIDVMSKIIGQHIEEEDDLLF
tara:strand:+ start:2763 stop:3383 length:621 start_codon:yes stop_codon:yes gene_type:complete